MKTEKFSLLNSLRGASALFVVLYHYFIFFFAYQRTSAGLLGLPPEELVTPFYLGIVEEIPFDLGHLGVSFFFLISGFLIPLSLQKRASFMTYLSHKFWRLWPTYAVCFSLGLIFVFLLCLTQERPFPYTLPHILSYFFWVRDLFHYPYIDGAVWTLEIQIKFYVFAGLIWYGCRKKFLEVLCLLPIFLILVLYGTFTMIEVETETLWYTLRMIGINLKFFLFMNIGTCLFYYYKKEISHMKALCLGLLLLGFFVSPLTLASSQPPLMVSYLLGMGIFTGAVIFKKMDVPLSYPGKNLNEKVSAISYPLYICHVLPGYTIMYYFIDQGWSLYMGIFVSLIVSFSLAIFVHKSIEMKFLPWIKSYF